jgi:uncharacterized protein YbjQ (UPF0145 family)
VAPLWFQVLPFLLFLALGFAVGGFVERAHFRRLEQRERELADIQCTDTRALPTGARAEVCGLVTGEVVIASDYFKTFAAAIRRTIGGNLRAYETLMERARREALVRMLSDAQSRGANFVANIRLASSNIGSGGMSGSRRRGAAMVEIYAYGTAYRIANAERGET